MYIRVHTHSAGWELMQYFGIHTYIQQNRTVSLYLQSDRRRARTTVQPASVIAHKYTSSRTDRSQLAASSNTRLFRFGRPTTWERERVELVLVRERLCPVLWRRCGWTGRVCMVRGRRAASVSICPISRPIVSGTWDKLRQNGLASSFKSSLLIGFHFWFEEEQRSVGLRRYPPPLPFESYDSNSFLISHWK